MWLSRALLLPEPAILLAAEDAVLRMYRSLPFEYTQSLLEWFDERDQFGG